jgi:hypothetical protein
MKGVGWDLITAVFIVAVIYMLVRPNSPAAGAVKSLSDFFVGIVGYATGSPPKQA